VYVRGIDGSPPVRLGDGSGGRLSPDGHSVLVTRATPPVNQLYLYPIGTGETRQLTHDTITHQNFAWLPGGRRILFVGYEPNQRNRLYVEDLGGGPSRAVRDESVGRFTLVVAPDGNRRRVRRADGMLELPRMDGGPST